MSLTIKTPPAAEPVSLSEAKGYLSVTDTADDSLISSMITAARQQCENFTDRALVTQTWTLWLDGFPKRKRSGAADDGVYELPVDHFDGLLRFINLPRPPLLSVSFLKTYDSADNPAAFPAASYFVDVSAAPGRLALNQAASWPSVGLRPVNGIEIEFDAGYGGASAVPAALKQGMLLWIKLLYSDKSWLFETDRSIPGLIEFNRAGIPPQTAALWSAFRLMKF